MEYRGSAGRALTDTEFLQAFESCELSNEGFHHRDHIRLAWIHVRRYGPEAGPRISASIRKFAAHHGKHDLYHETITLAWMQLVQHAAEVCGPGVDFEHVAAAFPALLDKNYLCDFYTDAVLTSQLARETFVQPDRRPLPVLVRS